MLHAVAGSGPALLGTRKLKLWVMGWLERVWRGAMRWQSQVLYLKVFIHS